MQTSLVKWLCIKNTIPPCMQQPFANIVAFFERCVALLPNFKENPPMYVLHDFRNPSIPVGKCSMLFCKIESILELLQHGFEKSAILLTHWLKHVFYLWKCRFLFAKCATLLKGSVARACCRFHWWCKRVFKNMCFFNCKASIAPPSAIWPFKEYNCSMDMLFRSEKGAMWLDFQEVVKMCNILSL